MSWHDSEEPGPKCGFLFLLFPCAAPRYQLCYVLLWGCTRGRAKEIILTKYLMLGLVGDTVTETLRKPPPQEKGACSARNESN
ncbi:hypothetical protein DM02DRAFT_359782 [Periconia macrospinosa]|uniref:Uncharacterized protein n=1 Tax=Periconia macrospinosa TaxID=97972 RepID=A0A2V1DTA2_9PLEO|nr:hypothetical protein DM02DRAFT_359782 [Periconia macrospinosa]